ncbi:hypothetical protein D6C93_08111, partial [Aureobasidium pullulans]
MTGLRISTIAITSNSSSHDLNYDYVPNAFSFQQGGNVRTLNSGYSPPPSTGLLYVPDLDGVCAQYLPDNVTRYSDLPMVPPKIAIAPWISPACTLSYLNAAPSDLITAFVFYIPNASAMALPSAHDAAWSLGDGGHWKSVISYPVYAIASQVGQMTLEQMARNSSNNTNAPIDQAPSNQTYIRLLMEVTTGSGGTNLPSIWVFLLIILAVLLVLIGALSLTMHILQRKRRNDLRARIARGEVDIEALGLGKLTVPQEMIDRMPLYAYSSSPDPVVPEKGAPHAPPPLQQPTCAICLDDFAESASQMMQGFGVNTYTLVNDKGERHLVKFHFTPHLGVHSFVWDEALKLAGQDPDFHRKDLWTAIEGGQYPKWKFGIQTIPEDQADNFEFDPLDATKIWPEEEFPVRYLGELELNRNVDEYFTQTEQVAFCTGHVVPGIGFSDDPLLQGRNFSYSDTQLSRLGTNWQELPINKP